MLKRKIKRRKTTKKLEPSDKDSKKTTTVSQANHLIEQIKNSAAGLYYVSETDAEIYPFVGETAESVSREVILSQTKNQADVPVEEREFGQFFTRLTEIQDWFGDEEKETAKKYLVLKEVLEKNLRDLKVFKVGKIQLNIYVVGLDVENRLLGIKTEAVET